MKIYVLDASAVVRYIANGNGAEKVDVLIQRAIRGEVQLCISVVNWGEALYSLAQKVGMSKAKADFKALGSCLTSVDVHEAQAEAAANVRLKYKLGYADCFAAALAMSMNATLVTTDSDFNKLGRQVNILPLPRNSS